jgi:hypothetical protein
MRTFDPDGARADLSEAIAQFRATGSYTSLAAQLDSLGVLEPENGDLEAAQVYLHEAVAIAAALALPRFRWGVHTNLGYLAIMRADPGRAFSVWLEAFTICDEVPALRDEPLNYFGAALGVERDADRPFSGGRCGGRAGGVAFVGFGGGTPPLSAGWPRAR